MAKDAEKQVILEYISVGNYVKVSAIDPKTRIEVSIVGDPKQGEEALKRIAVRKLHYVLQKKSREKKTGISGDVILGTESLGTESLSPESSDTERCALGLGTGTKSVAVRPSMRVGAGDAAQFGS